MILCTGCKYNNLGKCECENPVGCDHYLPSETNERVDHPSYYQGKIEVIDFIEDKELGFHLGNAIKYIARAGKKTPDAKEDIEKAIWYLERYLKQCGL